ncbi:MAG: hypothetical protein JW895_05450 [Thermoleophilaceae bacterium]|nr:hypothetical protein [Thermoleophilaceae bacterium]
MRRLALISILLTGAALPAEAGSGAARTGLPGERLVLGLHPPERIAVLDLATGAVEQRPLPGGTLCHGPLMAGGRRPLSVRPAAPGTQYLRSARPGAFWALRLRFGRVRATTTRVRELAADGRTLFRPRRRPPPGYPEAAVRDGIVFEDHGRRRVWNPHSGSVRRAGGDWLVAASMDGSVWCDGPCRRLRIHMTGRAVALAPPGSSFLRGGGRLSPDGSLLAVALQARAGVRIALVDTARGSLDLLRIPAAGRGALAWSTTGEWLYAAATGRRVAAHRPRDGTTVMLPLRLRGEVLDMLVTRSTSPRSAGS